MSKKKRKPNNHQQNRNNGNNRNTAPKANVQTASGDSSAQNEAVVAEERPEATLYQPGVTEYETPSEEAAPNAEVTKTEAYESYDETEESPVNPMQEVMKEHTFYAPRSSEESDWDEDEEAEEEAYNRDSVNRLKKLILVGLVVLFLIPIILCLILFFRMNSMEDQMEQLRQDLLSKKERIRIERLAEENASKDAAAKLDKEAYAMLEKDRAGLTPALRLNDASEKDAEEASTEEEVTTEEVDPSQVEEGKKIYLTFDDGPSENTGRLLDVLKEENVKATFFMVLDDKCDQQVIRRMAAEGHTLGIHSASHVYGEIYGSLQSFKEDVQTVHDLLYEMTGQDVKLYRFPGGSSNRVADVPIEDCIDYLEEEGYTYFDWNASNGDSSGCGYTADQLTENVLRYVRNNTGASVVLMHDFTPCPETIDALPGLIETLRAEGYVFLPIDKDTTPVHHRKTRTEQEEEYEEEQARLEKASEEKAALEKASEERAAAESASEEEAGNDSDEEEEQE